MFLGQQKERSKVKALVRALTQRTISNGCTEAEALAAAETVGRLLERFGLSMSEIESQNVACCQLEVTVTGTRRRPIDSCVPAIARFCNCKVWLKTEDHHSIYVFFGLDHDATMARYLFLIVNTALRNAISDFRQQNPTLRGGDLRRESVKFQYGFATRVTQRLDLLGAARHQKLTNVQSVGRDLVVVTSVVVEEAFKATAIRTVRVRRPDVPSNGNAFESGVRAGEQICLQRPLEDGSCTRLEYET